MNIGEFKIIQQYKEFCIDLLRYNFPDLSLIELNDAIDYSMIKRCKDNDAIIENNYKNKQLNTSVLNLLEYIIQSEPIITSFGVMFKKHDVEKNPVNDVIQGFLKTRKAFKKEMFKYPKGSEMFEKYNLLQLLAKIDSNGFYGAMGMYSCIYFNINVSSSVTAVGQSAISAAGLAFEMFLANNVKFMSLNEVVTFINNVLSEAPNRQFNDNMFLDRDIPFDEVFIKIMSTCGHGYIPDEKDCQIVFEIISKLGQQDLNRLYYKNNLYEFMENNSMNNAVITLLKTLKFPYMDPNERPKEIDVELEIFYELLDEYVCYNHQIIDRIDRLSYLPRKVCAIIDTDSKHAKVA